MSHSFFNGQKADGDNIDVYSYLDANYVFSFSQFQGGPLAISFIIFTCIRLYYFVDDLVFCVDELES